MDEDAVKPTSDDDREGWKAYWMAQGMTWRTEPEVGEERRHFLGVRRAVRPNIDKGIYPFRDEDGRIKLNRADVEWLLATHISGGRVGPLLYDEVNPGGRNGLDLAGADLQGADLSELPLAGLGKVKASAASTLFDYLYVTPQQHDNSSTYFDGANLSGIHLEGAHLPWAQFQGANLTHAHLDGAWLAHSCFDFARLNGASLVGTVFEEASLKSADLSHVCGVGMSVEGAVMVGAKLETANLKAARLVGTFLQDTALSFSHLEGADLHKARLQGADLEQAYLCAAGLDEGDLHLLRKWKEELAERLEMMGRLNPADLTSAFFDGATNLSGIRLGSVDSGAVRVADAQWGGVNLSAVTWATLIPIGDEIEARRLLHKVYEARDTRDMDNEVSQALSAAIRANRQLASALRSQGMQNEADNLSYRAHVLQRDLYWYEGHWGKWVFSGFLQGLAGYGYRPGNTVAWYVLVIMLSTIVYCWQGVVFAPPHTPGVLILGTALVDAITAVHGRGFFPSPVEGGWWQMAAASVDAVAGLLIEASFIATFTQRYFGR